MATLVYWLLSALPCSTVVLGAYYAYNNIFFDAKIGGHVLSIDGLNKDISLNQKKLATLTTLKFKKELEYKQALIEKANLSAQLIANQNGIVSATNNIDDYQETIKTLSTSIDVLEKSIAIKTPLIKADQQRHTTLFNEVQKLAKEEIEANKIFEAEKQKGRDHEASVKQLQIDFAAAEKYKTSKAAMVSAIEAEISNLDGEINKQISQAQKALEAKIKAEQVYNQTENSLNQLHTNQVAQAKQKDSELAENIKTIIEEHNQKYNTKIEAEAEKTKAEAEENKLKQRCQETLESVNKSNSAINSSCEIGTIPDKDEPESLTNDRQAYFAIVPNTKNVEQKYTLAKTALLEVEERLREAKKLKNDHEEVLEALESQARDMEDSKRAAKTTKDVKTQEHLTAQALAENLKKQKADGEVNLQKIKKQFQEACDSLKKVNTEIKEKEADAEIKKNLEDTQRKLETIKQNKEAKEKVLEELAKKLNPLEVELEKEVTELALKKLLKEQAELNLFSTQKTLGILEESIPDTETLTTANVNLINSLLLELEQIKTQIESLKSEIHRKSEGNQDETNRQTD